ncbi:MAG: hypothetical protein K5917_00560 [Clostridiales bacterium]|nr:hypothetical protein [Clostridiales bacterium]
MTENTAMKEEIFEFAFQNIQEGVIVLDDTLKVFYINSFAAKLFSNELSVENFVGENLYNFTKNQVLINAIDTVAKEGKDASLVVELSKEMLTTRFDIKKFQQNGDDMILLLLKDVTKEVEASKMRQEFFANMAHKLKTPITSIRGFAELLDAGIAKDETQRRDFSKKIVKETKNLTDIINDVLMISKLDCSDYSCDKTEFSLKPLIYNVENNVLPLAKEKNIKLVINCEDIKVVANQNYLLLAIDNLIFNAIKYNKENGNIKVDVSSMGNYVKIVVEDSGIGISPEAQLRIFERFYRSPEAKLYYPGGAGLGLSIVKHIANGYNGSVSFETEQNKGSKFTMLLSIKKID